MDKNVTVLQGIIEDVATELYQQWYNSVPASEVTEDSSKAMMKNAFDTSFFVIQRFMEKFNKEAEALKSVDDQDNI
jgi:hypothetical protein